MNQRRLLISLLVLATVCVDCAVVLPTGSRQAGFPSLSWILASALQLSQVSLAAAWLALGRTPGPARLLGMVAVVAGWSCAMAARRGAAGLEVWTVLLLAQTGGVGGPLLVARWLGLGLGEVSTDLQSQSPAARAKKWQFSIAYLLGWTTALAVALSALRCVGPFESLPFWYALARASVVEVTGSAALAWVALWAVLGARRRAMGMISVGVVGVLCVAAGQRLSAYVLSWYLPQTLLEALLLLGMLAVCRTAGYRLRWGQDR